MPDRTAPHPLPCIALAGPTAVGKTACAMAIARAMPGQVEIISVDSALVYRGMDIGTAKPDAAERAAVLHHLIDIRDPLEPYSAAAFVQDANQLIAAITARGRRALLVGGTMLYFKALFEGLHPLPSANAAVRAAIEDQARALGWPALHTELARVDPATAARLAPADAQRIQRALEVWRLTGRPLSTIHAESRLAGTAGAAAPEMPLISLEPADRTWLHARIAQRFDTMLAAGLIEEVMSLRARGDLNPELPSMRCVGYRQAWEALDGQVPMRELRDRGVFATRQLAKRQITWLRGMPGRIVVPCDRPDASEQVLQRVRAHWGP
jgi:tRNA dimethylallyltransferase